MLVLNLYINFTDLKQKENRVFINPLKPSGFFTYHQV